MEKQRIEKEMRDLELIIHYHFINVSWLAKAMFAKLVEVPGEGKNHKEYINESLATVGDTILKSVLADKLYCEGKHVKGIITSEKSNIENNEAMYKMINDIGIIDFAYHETFFYKDNPPDNEKVANPHHTPYIEAIVGAVYYDSNYDTTRRWILKWLLPLLEKYK